MSKNVTVKVFSRDARVLDETVSYIISAINKVSGSATENATAVYVEPRNSNGEQVRHIIIDNLNDKLIPALAKLDVPHIVSITVREGE